MTFQVSDRREILYTEQSENASPELLLFIGFCLFVCLFDSLRPINNLSVKQGRVFLG